MKTAAKMVWSSRLLGCLWTVGCCAGASPQQARDVAGQPVLAERAGDLYVLDLPLGLPRTGLLYALDPAALSGTRVKAGVLMVLEPRTMKVGWFCRPASALDSAIRSRRVAVEIVPPDVLMRFDACWGRFLPRSRRAPVTGADPYQVDLLVDIGTGDGVAAGDEYEVLGSATLDLDSRAAGFPIRARCIIDAAGLSATSAICTFDARVHPGFRPEDWERGGHVHSIRRAAATGEHERPATRAGAAPSAPAPTATATRAPTASLDP